MRYDIFPPVTSMMTAGSVAGIVTDTYRSPIHGETSTALAGDWGIPRATLTSRTTPRYTSRLSVTANCMANHKSAEKRIRQTAKRTAIDRARVSRVRTFVKKVEAAIATGDKATAARPSGWRSPSCIGR